MRATTGRGGRLAAGLLVATPRPSASSPRRRRPPPPPQYGRLGEELWFDLPTGTSAHTET